MCENSINILPPGDIYTLPGKKSKTARFWYTVASVIHRVFFTKLSLYKESLSEHVHWLVHLIIFELK